MAAVMAANAAGGAAPPSPGRTGVRHLLAGYDLSRDRLYRHIKTRKGCTEFLPFRRYLRTLHPPSVRIAIVLDNSSPHLSTKTDPGSPNTCQTGTRMKVFPVPPGL